MSKLLLYNDWLTTLGGGERYLFALAEAAAADNEVVIGAPALPPPERMAHLGFSDSFELREIPRARLPETTESFDVFVHLTTRLPMPSRAKRSFVVVQFPMDKAGPLSSWRHPRSRRRIGDPRRALAGYQFLVYSEYARSWLARRWGVDSTVLSPPLLTGEPPSLQELLAGKKDQILSVGRFFGDGSMKRQDLLLDAYKALPERVRQSTSLVLAGVVGGDTKSKAFVDSLRRSAKGFDVSFVLDATPKELSELYRVSSVFWHAAGAGRPRRRPDLAEHFGMVTVEAMSRAVVPVVYADGGQLEVVTPAVGLTWRTREELVDKTASLLGDGPGLERYRRHCFQAAEAYEYERFLVEARRILLDQDRARSGLGG